MRTKRMLRNNLIHSLIFDILGSLNFDKKKGLTF